MKRSHTVTSFEPFTLLSALSQVTENIGLVATGSTTFDAPYHIARRFASLDHLSGGRAGWNIVTTSNPDAALNFGMDALMEHGERYERAREFYDVVTGLWDSWADDAFIRDVESGIFLDPAKMHVLGHKGEYLSVRGPLNIARPVQGWPVIVQAGASDAGRRLAAETAEAVFTAQSDIAAGRAFYADVKGRMEKIGRAREHMKILPACFVVVGETVEEAREKRARLDSLVDYANAIASLSIALGHDASQLRPRRAAAGHPGEQPEQERTRARDRAGEAREPHRAPACAAARRLFGPRDGRHRADDRGRDAGMARDRRRRRLHRHVPVPARRARRFLHPGRAGTAAARNLPPRIRGQDVARESGTAAAEEQVLCVSAIARIEREGAQMARARHCATVRGGATRSPHSPFRVAATHCGLRLRHFPRRVARLFDIVKPKLQV